MKESIYEALLAVAAWLIVITFAVLLGAVLLLIKAYVIHWALSKYLVGIVPSLTFVQVLAITFIVDTLQKNHISRSKDK